VYEIIKNKTLMIKHVFHLTVNGQHFPMHSTAIASNKRFLIITTTTTVLRPFFRDYPGEPVPEEKHLDFMAQGKITEADTPTIQLGATPSGITGDNLHYPPIFYSALQLAILHDVLCKETYYFQM